MSQPNPNMHVDWKQRGIFNFIFLHWYQIQNWFWGWSWGRTSNYFPLHLCFHEVAYKYYNFFCDKIKIVCFIHELEHPYYSFNMYMRVYTFYLKACYFSRKVVTNEYIDLLKASIFHLSMLLFFWAMFIQYDLLCDIIITM